MRISDWSSDVCSSDLTRSYHDLLVALPPQAPVGRCFPAGHASAGYAWVALFFFFGGTRPQWRWKGLVAGLCAGLVFGVSQQLRGAHFASHDAWTLMVCWQIGRASCRERVCQYV